MTTRKILTFGVLPTYAEFRAHFDAEMGDERYSIRHGQLYRPKDWEPEARDYTCRELYQELQRLTALEAERPIEDDSNADTPGSWASSILSTLEFEWI